jgi:hypothetical protein
VDHAKGGKDDISNAVAGVCSLIGDHRNEPMNITPELLAMAADPKWRDPKSRMGFFR